MTKRTKHLSRKAKLLSLVSGIVIALCGAAVWYFHDKNFQLLNPAGQVASEERRLFVVAALMSVAIIVPVFILLFSFAWRYREGNAHKAHYQPNLDGSRILETIWWIIPGIMIVALSLITWHSSHALDPSKPLSTTQQPLKIQVIALQWKWLFLYPEQGVASVNEIQIPTNTPVQFDITADAPMNSFWVPQLGGQIYAMPGMVTKLNLNATKAGTYQGRSANLSGEGFSDMTFAVHAGSQTDFNNWLNTARAADVTFDAGAYSLFSQPSRNEPAASYPLTDATLFDEVTNKFMAHGSSPEPAADTPAHIHGGTE